MELSYSVIVLSLLCGVLADFDLNFFSDDDDYYDDTSKYAETSFSSLLIKCERSEGICIQAAACPWNRILEDHKDRCLQANAEYVCCKVAQVRMPVDLFGAYGF